MPRSFLGRFIADLRLDILYTIVFYCLATGMTVVIVAYLQEQGLEVLPALALGAGSAVIAIWFLYWIFWQVKMRVVHGAPFHIEDQVEITDGQYEGTIGTVSEIIENRNMVRVIFTSQTDTQRSDVFRWNEIRRISTR